MKGIPQLTFGIVIAILCFISLQYYFRVDVFGFTSLTPQTFSFNGNALESPESPTFGQFSDLQSVLNEKKVRVGLSSPTPAPTISTMTAGHGRSPNAVSATNANPKPVFEHPLPPSRIAPFVEIKRPQAAAENINSAAVKLSVVSSEDNSNSTVVNSVATLGTLGVTKFDADTHQANFTSNAVYSTTVNGTVVNVSHVQREMLQGLATATGSAASHSGIMNSLPDLSPSLTLKLKNYNRRVHSHTGNVVLFTVVECKELQTAFKMGVQSHSSAVAAVDAVDLDPVWGTMPPQFRRYVLMF